MMELRFSFVLVFALVFQCCGARPQTSNNLDVDVTSILTTIFSIDENRATDAQVVVNIQKMASKKNPDHDNAPDPLFTTVDSALLNGDTYSAFQSLVATFTTPSVDLDDPMTSGRTSAIGNFFTAIQKTQVFTQSFNFLRDNGIVSDVSTFIQQLNKIWFTPYARNSAVGSSGFESVFVGEIQGNDVVRANNWLGFYLKEKDSVLNYHGWLAQTKNVALELQWMWGKAEALDKAFLLMASPEAEFLAYTVCALAGAGKSCPATIKGSSVHLIVTTRNGADGLIDEAHPTIDSTPTTTTTKKLNTQPADDGDLQAVVDAMRAADTDRALDSDYTLDWGNKVSGTKDMSPNPLFKEFNESVFNRPIYQKQIYIYDQQYFHADTCIQEPGMSGFRKAAVMDWLNTVYNTTIFQHAYQYLLKKGKCTDMNDLQTKLFMLWFGTYNRCTSNKSILGSSGWEHVFSGEWKESTVDGHHSWVNYYRQEKAGQIDYHGYYSYEKQLTGTFQYVWSKELKKTGGFLIGTSPAFDFSLLTICVLTHPNSGNCKFTLDGFVLGVTSYTEACDAGTCISTAYPTDS